MHACPSHMNARASPASLGMCSGGSVHIPAPIGMSRSKRLWRLGRPSIRARYRRSCGSARISLDTTRNRASTEQTVTKLMAWKFSWAGHGRTWYSVSDGQLFFQIRLPSILMNT